MLIFIALCAALLMPAFVTTITTVHRDIRKGRL